MLLKSALLCVGAQYGRRRGAGPTEGGATLPRAKAFVSESNETYSRRIYCPGPGLGMVFAILVYWLYTALLEARRF